ncbi:MAG: hypothetical protein ABIN67_07075 [Ferruginibacter sp.]
MQADDLKKELVALIETTNDEELLSLLREDMVFYGRLPGSDVTDNLSDEQLNDLKLLAEEMDEKETHTLVEFKNATQQWRTR